MAIKKVIFLVGFVLISFVSTLQAQNNKPSFSLINPSYDFDELSEKLGFAVNEKDTVNIELYSMAADWLGVRYKWGGNTRKEGVDCSGFTKVVYDALFDKDIERSSNTLSQNVPVKITTPAKLKPGDMVFFATSKRHKKINHVGVYLKDGYFVHASSAKGKVMVSTLLEGFYKKAWRMGGRMLD